MNRTKIEWTDFTSNPIRAQRQLTPASKVDQGHYCEKISPGCKHCYASKLQPRFGMPTFGDARRGDITPYLDERELASLLRRRKPCKVFLGDMTDIFGSWVPDEWLDQIFAVMALTPHITYQALTKRAARMREYFTKGPAQTRIRVAMKMCKQSRVLYPDRLSWPLPNLWLGVSAENQEYADQRIAELRDTPAAVRFVSFEPLLSEIRSVDLSGISWCVVGGESGPNARPCDIDSIRSLVEQCKAAGTACFVKQLGAVVDDSSSYVTDIDLKHPKGGDPREWPEDIRVREFPQCT